MEQNKNKLEIYVTHVQTDELMKCEDTNKRQLIALLLTKLTLRTIATESTILGVSRLGECKLTDDDLAKKLKGNTTKWNDALIGEVAIKQNLILITEDMGLQKRVNSNRGKSLNLEEFKKLLMN